MQPLLTREKDFFREIDCAKTNEKQIFVEAISLKGARTLSKQTACAENVKILLTFFQKKAQAKSSREKVEN